MKALQFIDMEDILQFTTISGNVDINKLNPSIYNAQILYIEPILGSDLYNKIANAIDDDTITGSTMINYYNLVLNYIAPSLAFHTMELFVPFNSFEISDGGMSQHRYTNADYSPFDDIDRIVKKYKILAAKFDDKLVKYLCENSTLFPEYTSNTGLIDKTETTSRSGWFLGTSNIKSKIRR